MTDSEGDGRGACSIAAPVRSRLQRHPRRAGHAALLFGVPVVRCSGEPMMSRYAAVRPLTRLVHDAPGGVSFKQMKDGSVVGTDAPNPPATPAHQAIRAHTEQFPTAELRDYHGRRILSKIGRFLPGAQDAAAVPQRGGDGGVRRTGVVVAREHVAGSFMRTMVLAGQRRCRRAPGASSAWPARMPRAAGILRTK